MLVLSLLNACNSDEKATTQTESSAETFKPEKINGKLTTDFATAQEMKSLHYTIENFTLLNKKKFENLKAYQQFGDMMQIHIDRITASCRLDHDSKALLCRKLDKIKTEINTLHGDDMAKSKEAVKNINLYLTQIDSTFHYMN